MIEGHKFYSMKEEGGVYMEGSTGVVGDITHLGKTGVDAVVGIAERGAELGRKEAGHAASALVDIADAATTELKKLQSVLLGDD